MDEHKRLDTDGSINYILAGENNFENISSIFRFRTTWCHNRNCRYCYKTWSIRYKLWYSPTTSTVWKVSKYGVISGPYFPVFGLNTKSSCCWRNPAWGGSQSCNNCKTKSRKTSLDTAPALSNSNSWRKVCWSWPFAIVQWKKATVQGVQNPRFCRFDAKNATRFLSKDRNCLLNFC